MEMLSGGELFQMQQEAIERARKTAGRANNANNIPSVKEKESAINKKPFNIKSLLGNLKGNDNIILIGLLLLLVSDGCEDELLLLGLIFLLLKG